MIPSIADREIARRLLEHVERGTTDQAETTLSMPTARYVDPIRYQAERERIFKRRPLMLAFSCEIPEPGHYKTMDVAGVPVLLSRGADHKVRALLNICSHRGAQLVPRPLGKAGRFVCRYHGWSYATDGRLTEVTDQPKFGDVDLRACGLTELPCEERAGLIFVILTPGMRIDVAQWLGGMLQEIERFEFEKWYVHGRNELEGANWKVVYEGYLESYHFATLHPNTVATRTLSDVLVADSFGPHQKLAFPQHDILKLRERPESEWAENAGFVCIRALFPNAAISLGGPSNGGLVSQLIPGDVPGRSRTLQTFIFRKPPENEAERAMMDKIVEFYVGTVRDEDYAMGLGIQKGLANPAKEHFTFGRNEVCLHRFHREVERTLESDA